MADEHIKCIKRPRANDARLSWCGRNITMEFCFEGLDHVANNILTYGRLRACSRCLALATQLLKLDSFEALDEFEALLKKLEAPSR